MPQQIITGLCFGLGILVQAFLFVGIKFNKDFLQRTVVNIAVGFIFVFFFISPDFLELYRFSAYIFFIFFGAAFAFTFRKQIIPKINEIALFSLNILLLYYCVTRLGYFHPISIMVLIPTFISLIILVRRKLNISQKGFLYIWFLVLLISISIINLSTGMGFKEYLSSEYLYQFIIGYIFLNIWVFLMYLVAFVPISESGNEEGRKEEIKDHFLHLAASFNRSGLKLILTLPIFAFLIIILILNYGNKYIADNALITFIVFIASFISHRSKKFPEEVNRI